MKIGIMSDTHRNRELIDHVTDWLVQHKKINCLYHLGDDYCDTMDLVSCGIDIVQVPGLYDEELRGGRVPAKLTETVLGLRILLVHSIEKEVTPQDRQVHNIILHGHTHCAEIVERDGLLLMNPGHLKGPMDKHFPASYGILDIHDDRVTAAVYGLDHRPFIEMHLVREENGLYKAQNG